MSSNLDICLNIVGVDNILDLVNSVGCLSLSDKGFNLGSTCGCGVIECIGFDGNLVELNLETIHTHFGTQNLEPKTSALARKPRASRSTRLVVMTKQFRSHYLF